MSNEDNTKFAATQIGDKKVFVVPRDADGIVVWGPYQPLEPGEYDVTFDIFPFDYKGPTEPCCRIDIAADGGKNILFQRECSVGDVLANGGRVRATFQLKLRSQVEYRAFGVRGAGFRFGSYRKAYPTALRGQSPPLEDNPLYTGNHNLVSNLERGGIKFAVEDDQLMAEAEDLVLEVHSVEDLQLLHEIFLTNDYTVLPSGTCIAIDIGMNVGMASLALATNPQIEAVFAYEPFAVPFERAQRHFLRNAEFAGKIHPLQLGLADRNEEIEVKSTPSSSIGLSIRGAASGELERIRIRDAAQELGPKIEDAIQRGLGVLIKVDCEGSEFAIFESLKRAALFDKIDAFMVEWHKWWSADKTQAELIVPLREAGFFVFDHTQPANPHAGFFQAVRSARGAKQSNRDWPLISLYQRLRRLSASSTGLYARARSRR
jgi:FkbM family methyltransferase